MATVREIKLAPDSASPKNESSFVSDEDVSELTLDPELEEELDYYLEPEDPEGIRILCHPNTACSKKFSAIMITLGGTFAVFFTFYGAGAYLAFIGPNAVTGISTAFSTLSFYLLLENQLDSSKLSDDNKMLKKQNWRQGRVISKLTDSVGKLSDSVESLTAETKGANNKLAEVAGKMDSLALAKSNPRMDSKARVQRTVLTRVTARKSTNPPGTKVSKADNPVSVKGAPTVSETDENKTNGSELRQRIKPMLVENQTPPPDAEKTSKLQAMAKLIKDKKAEKKEELAALEKAEREIEKELAKEKPPGCWDRCLARLFSRTTTPAVTHIDRNNHRASVVSQFAAPAELTEVRLESPPVRSLTLTPPAVDKSSPKDATRSPAVVQQGDSKAAVLPNQLVDEPKEAAIPTPQKGIAAPAARRPRSNSTQPQSHYPSRNPARASVQVSKTGESDKGPGKAARRNP